MNHLQKKLFELASSGPRRKGSEVERYAEILNLSRSAVYDRINGKISISLDEAAVLLQTLGLSWGELLEGAGSTQPTRPRSLETTPEDYVASLHKDVLLLARQKMPQTWHECSAAPVFWLKHSRLLAAFKFYFWFRVFHPAHSGTLPLFTAQWAEVGQIKRLLDQSQTILAAYQTIPGLEIWSHQMFDRTIARIRYIQGIEGFSQQDMALRLLDEVQKVARRMERMAKKGNKSPDGDGGTMIVYENRTFASGNTLVGKAIGGQFLYMDAGYPDFVRYDDANVVEDRIGRLQSMLRHLEVVSYSERNCNVFFKTLQEHIDYQIKRGE